jgi:hypothetical protein
VRRPPLQSRHAGGGGLRPQQGSSQTADSQAAARQGVRKGCLLRRGSLSRAQQADGRHTLFHSLWPPTPTPASAAVACAAAARNCCWCQVFQAGARRRVHQAHAPGGHAIAAAACDRDQAGARAPGCGCGCDAFTVQHSGTGSRRWSARAWRAPWWSARMQSRCWLTH